ncbi:MAG: EAL domain-containing protein [Alphaproteobacteria bacterium]|nr:EAL domain-containing protein [Alphaproteobacteria bacterium]
MNATPSQQDIRDKFIAFSFAASDFLLEIDKQGTIIFAGGQVKTLVGLNSQTLAGKNWLSLFTDETHNNLKTLIQGVRKSGRLGPLMVELQNENDNKTSRALIMGMTLPENDNIYLALNATQSFLDFLTIGDNKDHRLLSEKEFESTAIKAFQSAKKAGKNLDITFLDTEAIEKYKETLSIDEANHFTENMQAIMKEQSFEGNAASQVDSDKYAIIHDDTISSDFIEKKIKDLIARTSKNTQDINVKSKTLEADMGKLNEREARRALVYTMNQMEKEGIDAVSDDLSNNFDAYLQENAAKITRLKALISNQAFKLNYQPIAFLPSEEICHYEALLRFSENQSPYEMIIFGEDIGIAPDIDMAVLKQGVGYTQAQLKKGNGVKIAINLSGQSVQRAGFFDDLLRVIDDTGCKPDNLLFEITESTAIEDLPKVNIEIQRLRTRGFEVCLDDFGAGSASFQYLNGLDIDCVKIDGKYVRDALNSARDEAMIRNLARMCQDLGVTTIAEMIETEEQLEYMVSIGVDKGQGWLFAKPHAQAKYTKRQK